MRSHRLLGTAAALAALTLTFAMVQPASAAPPDTAAAGASPAASATPFGVSPARTGVERASEVIVDPAVKLCRRVAAASDAAPQHLVERCRTWLAGSPQAGPSAAQFCRRVANAGEAAPEALVERCRTWLNGQATTGQNPIPPAAACRRIASADGVDPQLVERCRTWLNGLEADAEERPERGRARR